MVKSQEIPLSIQPIIRYPRTVEVNKKYLMEIDIKQTDDLETWVYEEEEYPIYCRVDTYSKETKTPLFKIQPIGKPAIVLHRFGGTYGPAKFLLTAASKDIKGEIRVTLVNGWGVALKRLRLRDISVTKEKLENSSEPSLESITISKPPKLETFESEIKVASTDFIDYSALEKLLKNRQFKEADEETYQLMIKIVGKEKSQYFDPEDLKNFPCEHLHIIDQLWLEYSNGHLGFSVQKNLRVEKLGVVKEVEQNIWNQFCEDLRWRKDDGLGYSNLTFELSDDTPLGHLPALRWSRGNGQSCFFSLMQRLLFCNNATNQTLLFPFKTPTVNRRGETIKTTTHTASYFTEPLTDNVILEMVAIPGGTFTMGSPETESEYDDERPQHNVTLSSFFMGKYPITQAQWKAIASQTNLKVNIDLDEEPSNFKGDNRPVEQVNWYEAVEFCQRLSKLTGRDYQLPSEAQWEYACRAMTEPLNLEKGETYPPFYFGETITGELANYDASETYAEEPKGEYREETTPVGQFPPNAFGLYDMHGNVDEWCADDWHDNYNGAPNDGSAWLDDDESDNFNDENMEELSKNDDNKPYSLIRGGSWFRNPGNCRSAIRFNHLTSGNRFKLYGFRVVCVFGRTL